MEHSITAARSRSLKDNFEGCPANPIFTVIWAEITLSHAPDMETCLTMEKELVYGNACHKNVQRMQQHGTGNFAKVEWEEGWPVINPGIGKLEDRVNFREKPAVFQRKRQRMILFISTEMIWNQV
ncbi:MAG: hypothetical protein ACLRMZ_13860 [Blautia marasmi]